MPGPEIEQFGKLLVEKVRDAGIRSADEVLEANDSNPMAKRWYELMRDLTPDEFATAIIPDIVDVTLGHLLTSIDQRQLPLSFTTTTGKLVSLSAEAQGHLAQYVAAVFRNYEKQPP
jgi:hypothetical protein